MVKQVFTFGFSHSYPNHYVVIEAETRAECRNLMFERFGDKWAFQYNDEESAGVYKFNLQELK